MKLAGFTVQELLYAAGETAVARARADDGAMVVLKYQDTPHPSLDWSARWQHEYAVLRAIESDWIIKARELAQVGETQVLVLEDFGTSNLEQLIAARRLDFPDRLAIACQLAVALSDVHKHRLIHGDISSKNVLVDTRTLKVKLCDFGLSSWLDREPRRQDEVYLRGTFEYMSPERTGRTNLEVDYRSDFYSLGVTLYELLLGELPFRSDDPMALLHMQIATMPVPLHEADAAIPAAVSEIVQKLLAKFPDDRYQSSRGLQTDLQTCLLQWQCHGRIERFELARADIPERFCLSQKLYGRDAETARLLGAFERVSNGACAELMLVAGYSGIGKTALVNQLHKPVVARRAYFIKGKCEQYSRNQPYGALVAAFAPLMRQMAGEGADQRLAWQARLRTALGESGAAITALVPELCLLIGEPAPLQALPAAETENRFHIAFAHFVRAIASGGRTLVLFLDDLQWADVPTLRLLAHLMEEADGCSALVIGAYRDNEVDASHPLTRTLETIEQRGGKPGRLQLDNLSLAHVSELIADTLRCGTAHCAPLAALCYEKTRGNPFFLGQFLRMLVEHGEVAYDRDTAAWHWDMEQIRQRQMTDNVVELMLEKLHKLSPSTRALCSLAAHLGNQFDMQQLMAAGGLDARATASDLWPALQAELVVPLSENYKFDGSPERLEQAHYRFLHDRVQQAARSLTADADRPALQLRAGRLLLAHTDPSRLDARLFAILDQLNSACALITDPAERQALLALNIRGGIKAKASSAYDTAVSLLRTGRTLLAADAWANDRDQTLALYRELSEAEYLAGHFDLAEQLYAEALAGAPDPLAKVTLQLVQCDQYQIQGRFMESLPVIFASLGLLGAPFPDTEEAAGALFPAAFAHTEQLLAARTEAQLLGAPELRDERHLQTMRVLNALAFSTYQTGRFAAYVLGACRFLQTTLEHGLCDLSCVAFVQYVTAMSAAGRPYKLCYAQGRLAIALAEQREDRYHRTTIYQYFSAFYQHWCEPLEQAFPYHEKGMQMGEEGINPLSAGYCALLNPVNQFVKGVPLESLAETAEYGLKFLQRSRQPHTEAMLRVGVLQPLRALQGRSSGPLSFDSADFSCSAFFKDDYGTPTIHLALYSTAMLRHAYLLEDPTLFQRFAANLPIIAMCLPDSPAMTEATYYVALGLLHPLLADPAARVANEERARGYRDTFERWAQDCPANYRHKHLLLAAELARVEGQDNAAMGLYAQAVDAAREAGFGACEALANERYARYWQGLGQAQLEASFIREAYLLYRRWGAAVKCEWIATRWPALSFSVGGENRRTATSHHTSTTSFKGVSEHSGMLDLQSLLKANQLLAEEIHLDQLLQKMIGVLLENAGAEQGAIVLEDEGRLVVEAMGRIVRGQHADCRRVRLDLTEVGESARPIVPDAIIAYVRDHQRTLILNNPVEDPRFSYNLYLRQTLPKSVMCLPVVSQGRLVAIIYLENNLLLDAFTPRHQKTLELLSSQAAISLVHARLVEKLEEKVSSRTAELRAMAMKDGLTGLANRRSFDERLADEWRRSARSGQPLALLMIDIDHFKLYNDHYGHLEGDACIRAVATALEEGANRATDMVARYGGEEFAVLIADADATVARRIAEKCIGAVGALGLPHAVSPNAPQVSISIGVASLAGSRDASPEGLIALADKALYAAKRGGRNRLAVAE